VLFTRVHLYLLYIISKSSFVCFCVRTMVLTSIIYKLPVVICITLYFILIYTSQNVMKIYLGISSTGIHTNPG
jgi:hypothetical protein